MWQSHLLDRDNQRSGCGNGWSWVPLDISVEQDDVSGPYETEIQKAATRGGMYVFVFEFEVDKLSKKEKCETDFCLAWK